MSSGVFVRLVATVAIVFALGFPGTVAANASAFGSQFALLDLEDDDGDGIPNYLDPDDNNDGVTDEDRGSEPEAEQPDTPTSDPVTPPSPDAGLPGTGETTSKPISSGAAVTALPNTGSGTSPELRLDIAMTGVALALLAAWSLRIRLQD